MVFSLTARGGERITFSAPKEEAEPPSRKDVLGTLPKAPLKWNPQGPEETALPPLSVPLDPVIQRKLRQRQEEQRNWLLNEPALFRERFPDPFKKDQATSEDGLDAWDRSVNRVFGKPEQKDKNKETKNKSAAPAFLDDSFSDRDGSFGGRPGASSPGGRESSVRERDRDREREKRPNSPEAAMKALFGPRETSDNLLALPGMSGNEELDKEEAKTLKREQQQKREEFQRLLSPAGVAPTGGLLDPINSLQDLTRAPAYPVAPVMTTPVPTARNALEPFGPPTVQKAFPRLGQLQEAIPGRGPTPVPQALPDKAHQMESVGLMSRPSVLTFPGRAF